MKVYPSMLLEIKDGREIYAGISKHVTENNKLYRFILQCY